MLFIEIGLFYVFVLWNVFIGMLDKNIKLNYSYYEMCLNEMIVWY